MTSRGTKGKGLEKRLSITYIYAWGNNERRKQLKGRLCKIIVVGRKMNTVAIEMLDTGEKIVTSRRALRRLKNDL